MHAGRQADRQTDRHASNPIILVHNVPVPLPVDLVEVEALVDDPVPAPGRLVAGHGDPELAVEEAEEEHRQHGEGEQVPLPARHEPVRAAHRPWSHQRVLRL